VFSGWPPLNRNVLGPGTYHCPSFRRSTRVSASHHAAGLALYQEAEQLLYYLAFVVGAAVCAAYFLYTNFWFLDVEVGGVHVRQLCVTIGLALMPTLMLPGLVRLAVPTTGALFMQQAWLVALMEEQLFVGCSPGPPLATPCPAPWHDTPSILHASAPPHPAGRPTTSKTMPNTRTIAAVFASSLKKNDLFSGLFVADQSHQTADWCPEMCSPDMYRDLQESFCLAAYLVQIKCECPHTMVALSVSSSQQSPVFQVDLMGGMMRAHTCRDSEESFYPAYFVWATSAMGVALARRMRTWGTVDTTASWAMQCIYIAKLSMIALPDSRPVQPILCVLLAASPPLFPEVLQRAERGPQVQQGEILPLKRPLGVTLAVLVVLAVAGARLVVFDAVAAVLGGAPPEGVLLGSLIAVAAAALAPLVYRCYGYSMVCPFAPLFLNGRGRAISCAWLNSCAGLLVAPTELQHTMRPFVVGCMSNSY
jgi:hypothetical protein